MYNTIDTQRVRVFENHFKKPKMQDIPSGASKSHPLVKTINADDWLQCVEFSCIYVLNNNYSKFYCSCPKCNKWLSTGGTIGNIKKHIKAIHLNKTNEIEDLTNDEINKINDTIGNINIPDEIDQLISTKIKKMILKTGRPFAMVADKDIQSCLKHLGNRKDLVEKCDEISKKVKAQMKYILNSGSFISIAVDEWSDLNKRRYLGMTAKCIFDGESKVLFLSLRRICQVHLSGEDLNDIMNSILDQYSIRNKVMNAVSDNCNLMLNTFTYSNISRLPCACHLISNLMKKFLKPSKDIIDEISFAIHSLKSSECYAALRDDINDPHVVSFTEIRWISLYESLKSLVNAQESINTYYEEKDETIIRLQQKHWEFIELILPLLKIYKSGIKILESDEFGTISFVINTMHRIKTTIENLPSDLFQPNITKFKKNFELMMNIYDEQFHPLYDAAVLLNPCVEKDHINVDKGIEFIENKMKELGWNESDEKSINNKTLNYLNPQLEKKHRKKSPIQRILDMGIVYPDIDENDKEDSIGKALFRFWKSRLDSGIDPILCQVAIGILSAFCTSCSAERFFSKAGRVLTRDRMKLMEDVAESQIIVMSNQELADKFCIFD